MSNLTPADVRPWIAERIVQFCNRAQSVSDITTSIQDDPSDGPGRAIGRTVARRMLQTRAQMPRRRFSNLEEIFAVEGLGSDKLEDLVYSLGTSAAQAFQHAMYEQGVIYRENWPLEFFSAYIEPAAEFEATVRDHASFRRQVVSMIEEECNKQKLDEKACQAMVEGVKTAYIDEYNNTSSDNPAYAFAQWFYRIDMGNFFFFESGVPRTRDYFEYHPGHPWEMELRLFKGVSSRFIRGGIIPTDLATVVNWPEQVITVWSTSLFD